jgi:hypothetical protein
MAYLCRAAAAVRMQVTSSVQLQLPNAAAIWCSLQERFLDVNVSIPDPNRSAILKKSQQVQMDGVALSGT